MNEFLRGRKVLFTASVTLEKIHWFCDCGKENVRTFTDCWCTWQCWIQGGKSPSRSRHFLIFFFRSSHKGTYRWLTCYEKQAHTFQAMTWKTLEQYFAGKCDIWDSPKMGVEWDGFSEETQKWSTFNKQLGPWHMRGHFLW